MLSGPFGCLLQTGAIGVFVWGAFTVSHSLTPGQPMNVLEFAWGITCILIAAGMLVLGRKFLTEKSDK